MWLILTMTDYLIVVKIVHKIENSLYVDDLVGGTDSLIDAFQFHKGTKGLMAKARMSLRKWNCNSRELFAKIYESTSSVKPRRYNRRDESLLRDRVQLGNLIKLLVYFGILQLMS